MTPKNLYGMIAEFDTPKQILNAASSVRKEGYVDFDCLTPFPVHGLDDAMGLKRSIVGFIVGIGCIVGATVGLHFNGGQALLHIQLLFLENHYLAGRLL